MKQSGNQRQATLPGIKGGVYAVIQSLFNSSWEIPAK
jgi:hypothetical protein